MKTITLSTHTEDGTPLTAAFAPDIGMNLVSYRLGDIEVIAQSTKSDFEKSRNGLGPLIGPHFHERKSHLIPRLDHEFSHEKFMRERNKEDIFSHGVSRYAAWKAETKEDSIHAEISGEDNLEGIPLSTIEGQNFKMQFNARLTPLGLKLNLSVISDADSLVGFHYYYALPNGKGRVRSPIQNVYIENGEKKSIPESWQLDAERWLTHPLENEIDYTFFSYPSPLEGTIILETDTYNLVTQTHCQSAENSWQLWHPKDASFVCIEPISSQDPRHPNLTVSSINATIRIQPV
jgi:galactose mutarotase-like enzyme